MASLRDVGLGKESPVEVILSTFYPDGRPHASAVGIKAKGRIIIEAVSI